MLQPSAVQLAGLPLRMNATQDSADTSEMQVSAPAEENDVQVAVEQVALSLEAHSVLVLP